MVYQWEPETQYNFGDVVVYEGAWLNAAYIIYIDSQT